MHGFFSGDDMKTDVRNILAFLVGLFIAAALLLPGAVFAAVTVTPTVPGYSGAIFKGGPGIQTTYFPESRTYGTKGVFPAPSGPQSVPAKVPLSSNAAALVKTAIRLNPTRLAGTLAAGWLLEQGLRNSSGVWEKHDPSTNTNYCVASGTTCCTPGTATTTLVPLGSATNSGVNCGAWVSTSEGFCTASPTVRSIRGQCAPGQPNAGTFYTWNSRTTVLGGFSPFPDSGWDSLPDPLPAVGPEIPNADWIPEGAPVDKPKYDFEPYSAPAGAPYKKPDGSTVQPMITVSPNNTSITYNTWNQTTINNLGQPVTDQPPIDQNQDEVKDPCVGNPDRAGCVNLGKPEDFAMPKKEHALDFGPEVPVFTGSCPAPIVVFGYSLSFQPACNAMTMIRPMVLGMSGMMAAFILFGAFRGGD